MLRLLSRSAARVASAFWAVAMFGLVSVACGPTYPNCASDDHCKTHGEYCVDSKCAQCRVDSHCPGAGSDVCVTCQKGACGRKPDCCSSKLDCGNGQKCANNKCIAECAGDTDCAAGQACVNGACTTPGSGMEGTGCKKDGDCGPGLKCASGKCIDSSGMCRPAPVYFDFNEYTLSSSAQDGIAASYKCMKEAKASTVTVEGHCDERGTDAYNMELGNRRAKAVKHYLSTLGPKLKVKTMSFGKTKPVCTEETESCWSQNRRGELKSDK